MHQDRLSRSEALSLLRGAPLLELMKAADAQRRARFPGNEVTFVFDTNPNYTNVCVTRCTFCSFYRPPGDAGGYVLSPAEVAEKAAHAQARGATTILLQGGHHPSLGLDYYLDLIAAIQQGAPGLHLHLFSPAEIDHLAGISGESCRKVLQRFWDAGLRTMPGGGAEILVERVRRKISPKKISGQVWLDIMRTAHGIGMKTTATMTYGHIETEEEIIDHLVMLRELQDETAGFLAFIPWSFKPGSSPLSQLRREAELPSYYLRIIAISRLVLDNIPHIQASWFGEGVRAGQLALHAGADDFGGVLLEENVLFQARHRIASHVENVKQMILDAEMTPVQRTTLYEKILEKPVIQTVTPAEVHQRRPGQESHLPSPSTMTRHPCIKSA